MPRHGLLHISKPVILFVHSASHRNASTLSLLMWIFPLWLLVVPEDASLMVLPDDHLYHVQRTVSGSVDLSFCMAVRC